LGAEILASGEHVQLTFIQLN